MKIDELEKAISNMFPILKGEDEKHYEFYIREATEPFRHKAGDLSQYWEAIKRYDGQKNRPGFGFFIAAASGVQVDAGAVVYYKCKCGRSLSASSGGCCAICGSIQGILKSGHPTKVLRCQGACHDCSIYSDKQMGPSCNEFGTPEYEKCPHRGNCNCRDCCRFEYLRAYDPERARSMMPDLMKATPRPKSAAGLAFYEGRASFSDIVEFLKRKGSKVMK